MRVNVADDSSKGIHATWRGIDLELFAKNLCEKIFKTRFAKATRDGDDFELLQAQNLFFRDFCILPQENELGCIANENRQNEGREIESIVFNGARKTIMQNLAKE